MANTVIQLKWSEVTSTPTTLNVAEPAYSNTSNKLFIGLADNSVVAVGGKYYTDIVDAATSSATATTLVKRDADGSFSANVVSADAVVVGSGTGGDITGANTVHANYFYGSLATPTGVTEGSYGSSTEVPVITVSANGLVTGVTTSSISTSLGIAGDTGTDIIALGTDTLTFVGGDGITSVVDGEGNNVAFSVDNTVYRTTGGQISGDVSITGNLIISGDTTYVNTAINQTYDSLIELAANNTIGDVLDIGFYGKHEGVDGTVVTGLVRNAGTSQYYLFDSIGLGDQTDISANVITQAAMIANGASLFAKGFFASEGGVNGTGFSFGVDQDTGMFSSADGHLEFFSNSVKAGEINVSNGGTSLGLYSAATNQGYRATAIGYGAGQTNQGGWATAIGLNAGNSGQGTSTVAVGHRAGGTNQGTHAVAVGVNSGQNSQGQGAVALGYRAGYGGTTAQGDYSIAIGSFTGEASQAINSIALNATGTQFNPSESGFYVNPVRYVASQNDTYDGITFYNSSTKEMTYSYVLSGGSF